MVRPQADDFVRNRLTHSLEVAQIARDLARPLGCHPDLAEIGDLTFAWRVVKHVKSNAIVLVKDMATVGIGAGPDCDAQVLVWQDMMGLRRGKSPRFVKRYANVADVMLGAAC